MFKYGLYGSSSSDALISSQVLPVLYCSAFCDSAYFIAKGRSAFDAISALLSIFLTISLCVAEFSYDFKVKFSIIISPIDNSNIIKKTSFVLVFLNYKCELNYIIGIVISG